MYVCRAELCMCMVCVQVSCDGLGMCICIQAYVTYQCIWLCFAPLNWLCLSFSHSHFSFVSVCPLTSLLCLSVLLSHSHVSFVSVCPSLSLSRLFCVYMSFTLSFACTRVHVYTHIRDMCICLSVCLYSLTHAHIMSMRTTHNEITYMQQILYIVAHTKTYKTQNNTCSQSCSGLHVLQEHTHKMEQHPAHLWVCEYVCSFLTWCIYNHVCILSKHMHINMCMHFVSCKCTNMHVCMHAHTCLFPHTNIGVTIICPHHAHEQNSVQGEHRSNNHIHIYIYNIYIYTHTDSCATAHWIHFGVTSFALFKMHDACTHTRMGGHVAHTHTLQANTQTQSITHIWCMHIHIHVQCAAGKYSDSGATVCVSCEVLYMCPGPGVSMCMFVCMCTKR
jgi:hypothetical protein